MQPQAPFDPKARTMWMLSRPKRRIDPWTIFRVLSIFSTAKGLHTQEGQDALKEELERQHLKRDHGAYHPKSGGMRTYEAQLRSLGLLYRREKQRELTVAGKALLQGTATPLDILRTQLLRFQYPSTYGLGQNVWMSPLVKVKPFLFILDFLHDREIDSLSEEELAVLVIYGHSHSSFELCKKKILQIRSGSSLNGIVDSPNDVYTVKMKDAPLANRLKEARENANVAKNYLLAAAFISIDSSGACDRIRMNPRAEGIYLEEASSRSEFIPFPENEVNFQRAFGRWDHQKDTAATSVPKADKKSQKDAFVLFRFLDLCESAPMRDIPEAFFVAMEGWNIDRKDVLRATQSVRRKAYDYFEARFITLSIGGAPAATEFEKAVTKLINERLSLKAFHTGQRRVKNKTGGFADVAGNIDKKSSFIVDAKAAPMYGLPVNDHRAMVDYVESYSEIQEISSTTLEFSFYVAGGFKQAILNELRALTEKCGVPCSAIDAETFLKICRRPLEGKRLVKFREAFAQPHLHVYETDC